MNYQDSGGMPLVSVYVTTKNRRGLVKRALQSIANQSYPNIEIILVDDGSDDGTEDDYSSVDEYFGRKFYYIKNHQSFGACHARNKAINAASGYYLTGLDDDDYFKPNRIMDFYEMFSKNKVKDIAFVCDSSDCNGMKKDKIITYGDMFFKNKVGNQVFSTVEKFKRAGLFDEKMPAWQDYDLWMRMLLLGDGIKIKEASQFIDIDHGTGRISKKYYKVLEAQEIFISKYMSGMSYGKQEKRRILTAFRYGIDVKIKKILKYPVNFLMYVLLLLKRKLNGLFH